MSGLLPLITDAKGRPVGIFTKKFSCWYLSIFSGKDSCLQSLNLLQLEEFLGLESYLNKEYNYCFIRVTARFVKQSYKLTSLDRYVKWFQCYY